MVVKRDGVAQRMQPFKDGVWRVVREEKRERKERRCVAVAVDGDDEGAEGQEVRQAALTETDRQTREGNVPTDTNLTQTCEFCIFVRLAICIPVAPSFVIVIFCQKSALFS